MQVSNRTDASNAICEFAKKNSLVNLSSVDKNWANVLNSYFKSIIPKELRNEYGGNCKRIFMHLIDSDEELIERINDFIAEVKPNTNYNFHCSFIKKLSCEINGCSIELLDPSVSIKIDTNDHASFKTAKFIFTENYFPSASLKNITIDYFGSKDRVIGPLDALNMGKSISDFIADLSAIPHLQEQAYKSISTLINYFVHNHLNIPLFNINSLDLNNLTDEQNTLLTTIVVQLIVFLDNDPIENQFMICFEQLKNVTNSTLDNLITLMNAIDSYSVELTGEKFNVDNIRIMQERFRIENFLPHIILAVNKNAQIKESFFGINNKLNLLSR